MGWISPGCCHRNTSSGVSRNTDFGRPLSLTHLLRATTQLILLPGNDYTSAEEFISNGSAAALSEVTNPDGSFDGLVFDVHKYLDSDNSCVSCTVPLLILCSASHCSGTNADCVTNNIDDAWAPLAQWLRCNGRQAFNTETGGGNTASCETFMCQQITFLNQNSDGKILEFHAYMSGH